MAKRNVLYSSHAVIALAICATVIVAIYATPDVAVVVGHVLAQMAKAAAATVKP